MSPVPMFCKLVTKTSVGDRRRERPARHTKNACRSNTRANEKNERKINRKSELRDDRRQVRKRVRKSSPGVPEAVRASQIDAERAKKRSQSARRELGAYF